MLPVELSPRAGADIDEILDYLLDNPERGVAADYGRRFGKILEMLELFPGGGSPRRKYGRNVRAIGEWPYIFFYEVRRDRVWILRIIDGHRKLTRKLVRTT